MSRVFVYLADPFSSFISADILEYLKVTSTGRSFSACGNGYIFPGDDFDRSASEIIRLYDFISVHHVEFFSRHRKPPCMIFELFFDINQVSLYGIICNLLRISGADREELERMLAIVR